MNPASTPAARPCVAPWCTRRCRWAASALVTRWPRGSSRPVSPARCVHAPPGVPARCVCTPRPACPPALLTRTPR